MGIRLGLLVFIYFIIIIRDILVISKAIYVYFSEFVVLKVILAAQIEMP